MATYTANLVKDMTVTDPPEGSTTLKELNDADREIKRIVSYKDTIVTKSSAYTMTETEEVCLASGTTTITLPTITTVSSTTKTKRFVIINTSTDTITVDTSGSDTINGASSVELANRYDCLIVYGKGGTDWYQEVNVNSPLARISKSDTTPGFLGTKLVAGNYVTLTDSGAGNSTLTVTVADLAIRDKARNLSITRPSVSTVAVTADELILQTTGGVSKRFASVSETIDITASGASGVDTGSEATSTWYFIWIVAKADGTINGLLSVQSAIDSITFPSGYTYGALVGAIYNGSDGNLLNIVQKDNNVICANQTALDQGTATDYTEIDLAAIIPSTAKGVLGYVGNEAAETTRLYISPTSDGSIGEFRVNIGVAAVGNALFDIMVSTAQKMYYKVSSNHCTVSVAGWRY